jgi:hypothetical protein
MPPHLTVRADLGVIQIKLDSHQINDGLRTLLQVVVPLRRIEAARPSRPGPARPRSISRFGAAHRLSAH